MEGLAAVEQRQAASKFSLDPIGGAAKLDQVFGERGVGQLADRLRGTAVDGGAQLSQRIDLISGCRLEHLYVS